MNNQNNQKGGNSEGKDPNSSDYETGYGKPPKHSQFKPGQSGNPKGRKKGQRGLKTELAAALDMAVTAKMNGQTRKATTLSHAMTALALKAAGGDLKAFKLLVDLTLQIFGHEDRGEAGSGLSKTDEALLDRFLNNFDENGEQESD